MRIMQRWFDGRSKIEVNRVPGTGIYKNQIITKNDDCTGSTGPGGEESTNNTDKYARILLDSQEIMGTEEETSSHLNPTSSVYWWGASVPALEPITASKASSGL